MGNLPPSCDMSLEPSSVACAPVRNRSSHSAAVDKSADGLKTPTHHNKRTSPSSSPHHQHNGGQMNGTRTESRFPSSERTANMEIREYSRQNELMKCRSLPVGNEYRFHTNWRPSNRDQAVDSFEKYSVLSLHSSKLDDGNSGIVNSIKENSNTSTEKSHIESSSVTDHKEEINADLFTPVDGPNQLSDTDEISAMTDMAHDGDDESTIIRRRYGLRATRNVEVVRHRIVKSPSNTSTNNRKSVYQVIMNNDVSVADEPVLNKITSIKLSEIESIKDGVPIYDMTLLEERMGNAEDFSIDIPHHAYRVHHDDYMSHDIQSQAQAVKQSSSNQSDKGIIGTSPQNTVGIVMEENEKAEIQENEAANSELNRNEDSQPITNQDLKEKINHEEVDNIQSVKEGDNNGIRESISLLATSANEWVRESIASLLSGKSNEGDDVKDENTEATTTILIGPEGESVEMNPNRSSIEVNDQIIGMNPSRQMQVIGSDCQSVEINPNRITVHPVAEAPDIYPTESTLVGNVIVGKEVDAEVPHNPSIVTVRGTELVVSNPSIIVHGIETDENFSIKSYPIMKVQGVLADKRDTMSLQSHRNRSNVHNLVDYRKIYQSQTLETSPTDCDSISTKKSTQQAILDALQSRPSNSMSIGNMGVLNDNVIYNESIRSEISIKQSTTEHETPIQLNEAIIRNDNGNETDSGILESSKNDSPPDMVTVVASILSNPDAEAMNKKANDSEDWKCLEVRDETSVLNNTNPADGISVNKESRTDAVDNGSIRSNKSGVRAAGNESDATPLEGKDLPYAVDNMSVQSGKSVSRVADAENVIKATLSVTSAATARDLDSLMNPKEHVDKKDISEADQPNAIDDIVQITQNQPTASPKRSTLSTNNVSNIINLDILETTVHAESFNNQDLQSSIGEEFGGIDLKFVEQYEEMYTAFLDKNPHLVEKNSKMVEILRIVKLQKILAVTADVEAELVEHVDSLENLKQNTSSYYHSKLLEAAKKKAAREIQLQQELDTIQQATHLMENKLSWQIISKSENRAKRHYQILENLSTKNLIDPNNPLNILPRTEDMRLIIDSVYAPQTRMGLSRPLNDQQLQELRQFQIDNAFLNAEALVLERKLLFLYETMKQNAWIDSFFRKLNSKQHRMLKHRYQNRTKSIDES